MKKGIRILCGITILTLFLSGCVQEDLIDVYLLSSRFNKLSETFEINSDALTAIEKDSTLEYTIMPSETFLITVCAEKDSKRIQNCTITYEFKKGEKPIHTDTVDQFNELCTCLISAFTNFDMDKSRKIIEDLKLNRPETYRKDNMQKGEQDFYYYTFISNKLGFSFKISSYRLQPTTIPENTLRHPVG